MRARAIGCALFYGVLPWRVYERECHYAPMSYSDRRSHLWMNLQLAARWATGREAQDDREFEQAVNGSRE